LLRQAMRGALPAAVLARRKTPLAASPLAQAVRAQGLSGLSRDKRLDRYVDPRALPVLSSSDGDVERLVAVQALDHWLASLAP
jgi:hypothetical protein